MSRSLSLPISFSPSLACPHHTPGGAGERSALYLAYHAPTGDPVSSGMDGQPPPVPQAWEVRHAGRSIGSNAHGEQH